MYFRLLLTIVVAFTLAAQAAEKHEHSPMHDKMEVLNRDLRSLKRDLSGETPKPAAQLALADKMVATVKELTEMKPTAKDGGPADPERLAEYNKRMAAVAKEVDRLRAALADGKTDEAKEIVKSLYQMKEQGHEALGVEDDH